MKPPAGRLIPRYLLRDAELPATTARRFAAGCAVTIPGRDGMVLKLK